MGTENKLTLSVSKCISAENCIFGFRLADGTELLGFKDGTVAFYNKEIKTVKNCFVPGKSFRQAELSSTDKIVILFDNLIIVLDPSNNCKTVASRNIESGCRVLLVEENVYVFQSDGKNIKYSLDLSRFTALPSGFYNSLGNTPCACAKYVVYHPFENVISCINTDDMAKKDIKFKTNVKYYGSISSSKIFVKLVDGTYSEVDVNSMMVSNFEFPKSFSNMVSSIYQNKYILCTWFSYDVQDEVGTILLVRYASQQAEVRLKNSTFNRVSVSNNTIVIIDYQGSVYFVDVRY